MSPLKSQICGAAVVEISEPRADDHSNRVAAEQSVTFDLETKHNRTVMWVYGSPQLPVLSERLDHKGAAHSTQDKLKADGCFMPHSQCLFNFPALTMLIIILNQAFVCRKLLTYTGKTYATSHFCIYTLLKASTLIFFGKKNRYADTIVTLTRKHVGVWV